MQYWIWLTFAHANNTTLENTRVCEWRIKPESSVFQLLPNLPLKEITNTLWIKYYKLNH